MKDTRPEFIVGNAIDVLRDDFEDDSVDLVPTSPPYWGLRDYGGRTEVEWPDGWIGQLGLEPTWQLYVQHLVEISKEIKRVLKPTGSYYLVLGDTYLDKDKLMIPYEVARALRLELDFIRRNDITWRKPNAMPSSVKDRLTCTTERIFHFVKARKYFYDLDAIRKPHKYIDRRCKNGERWTSEKSLYTKEGIYEKFVAYHEGGKNPGDAVEVTKHDIAVNRVGNFAYADPLHAKEYHPAGRNPGDYWSINTQPFPQAHFAVFPEALIEPIIKSSCPLEVCSACGKARERIVKRTVGDARPTTPDDRLKHLNPDFSNDDLITERRIRSRSPSDFFNQALSTTRETIGFTKCDCNAEFVPGVVLDPFCGSGTTNLVAMKLGRASIGIDINSDYIKIAQKRCRVDIPSLQDYGVGDE